MMVAQNHVERRHHDAAEGSGLHVSIQKRGEIEEHDLVQRARRRRRNSSMRRLRYTVRDRDRRGSAA